MTEDAAVTEDAAGTEDGTAGEFDTVAAWTAEALTGLPASCRIPGACRGSGNPSALAWLAEAMELTPSTRMLDAGGGIGGPAGWVAERYGVTPTVLEYVALRSDVPAAPAGNDFCSAEEIDELLASAGLLKVNATTGASLPPIPMAWQARSDRVKDAVAAARPGAAVLADADEQAHRFAELLSDGTLGQYLVHATVM